MKMIMLPVMLAMSLVMGLGMVSCASSESTDAEVRQAQGAVDAAELGLDLAQLAMAGYLTKPETPEWQLAAAVVTVNRAKAKLTQERGRLAEIIHAREALKAAELRPPPEPATTPHPNAFDALRAPSGQPGLSISAPLRFPTS